LTDAPAGEAEVDAARRSDLAVEALLEESWLGRTRAIRGRELRLELGMSAAFLIAAGALALSADPVLAVHPAAAAVVMAYALAARVEFPIGAGFFVPTQLFLVPLFVLAPAQYVPLLVFAALTLASLVAAATGPVKVDRVVFNAGDSVHALGPAVVITLLADGDATQAGPLVLLGAFVAQLFADFASSSLHALLTIGTRAQVHLRVMLQTWRVDVALGSVGLLAAWTAIDAPWAALAPVPLVLLLHTLAADRVRKISAAHERLVALKLERGRREVAGQLLERQTHFLQDVMHELRTPVTIARGHIEILRRATGPRPESNVALDELGRIERIVERLLVLARADHAGTFQLERLDAESLLEDRFVRWSDTIARPWQLGDLAAGTLIADGDAVRAALDALLENAVKHTNASEQIRLSSRAASEGIVIEVADAGSGIPAEALHQIFQRFARVDSDQNRRVGGIGLGLAMVDTVARGHGGRCSVESSHAGSAFSLRLPAFEPGETPGSETGVGVQRPTSAHA